MSSKISLKVKSFSPLIVVLLIACGGGDDNNAGAPVALNATPTEFSLDRVFIPNPAVPSAVFGNAPCGSGTQLIYVNGGAGPYTIQSTNLTYVTVDKAQINKGEAFMATLTGACSEGTSILIKDKNNDQIVVTANSTKSEAD